MANEYLQTVWLAALQGATEFLPVSSSGHLALWPHLTGWRDQGLAFDVAAHVGTLAAAVIYFRADVYKILRDWTLHIRGRGATRYSKLAWAVLIATLPLGVAGAVFAETIAPLARAPVVIALTTLIFGVLLGLADRFGRRARGVAELTWMDVALIGGAQMLALIPGVSRSGVTISAGLALGLRGEAAARFSFLLAMPAIALAGIWQTRELLASAAAVDWGRLAIAAGVSGVVAWLCIHYFLAFIQRHSLWPFAVYRVLLGGVLLAVFL